MNIFVYGTLKSGYGNSERCLRGAKLIGPATTDSLFVMYNVGFPFIVPEEHNWNEEERANAGQVVGEHWEINPEIHLAGLDRLESEGHLYDRVKQTINGGQEVELYQITWRAGISYRGNARLVRATVDDNGSRTVVWG